jgi:hypothetical protein
MAYIGQNNEAGMSSNPRTSSSAQLLLDGNGTYSPSSSEEVFRVGFYCTNYILSDVEIAVYDITGGTSGATLVGSQVITAAELTSSSWNTKTLSSPLTLTTGNTYAVGFKVNGTGNVALVTSYLSNGCSTETLTGASNFPASWSDTGTYNQDIAVYAETQAASGGGSMLPSDLTGGMQDLTGEIHG